MALKKADLLKKNLKKEKKSNQVIGDKSYNFYKIIWEDITGDSTIVSFNDFDKMETSIITTFATYTKKTINIYGLSPLTQRMDFLVIEILFLLD